MSTKSKATRLLTHYLKLISEEETEAVEDPKTNETRIATKAEKLARDIWKDALGWTEVQIKNGKAVDIIHKPSTVARALIYDRLEGRAPLSVTDKDSGLTASERVSEQGKKRINQVLDASSD